MKYTKENIKFMTHAIALAQKGGGFTHPNPVVGCVIVKNAQVIAEGWHKIFGGLHAEANALKQAGKNAFGADLYVTLEPCSKQGKQPPCTQAIIKAGVKRVFIASADSTQQGVKILKQAGVEVYTGLLAKEARALNKDFFAKTKPHITVKFAMTLDGKIATKNYDSKWITSEKSRSYTHALRSKYDAILVGANTLLKDNPSLTSHGKGKNPVRVVIANTLKLPKNLNVLDGKVSTVIVCDEKENKIPSYLNKEGIIILKIDFKEFKKDFNVLIKELNKIGLKRVFIEGGGETISSALFSGCVNDIFAFIAPVIVGGRGAISPVEGAGVDKIKQGLKLKNMKIQKIGSDILIRGNF